MPARSIGDHVSRIERRYGNTRGGLGISPLEVVGRVVFCEPGTVVIVRFNVGEYSIILALGSACHPLLEVVGRVTSSVNRNRRHRSIKRWRVQPAG